MKPTLKLCSSHSATGISKTPDLVTSLELVPLLFRARGTTRERLIEGAKQKHTQREGLYDLRIRCRGVGQKLQIKRDSYIHIQLRSNLLVITEAGLSVFVENLKSVVTRKVEIIVDDTCYKFPHSVCVK